MGRPSLLADPDFAKQVAECFANGDGRESMSAVFNVSKQTITKWRKDPRIKRLVHNMMVERVQRVTSKVDAVLEGRLAHAEDLTIKELLDIRKEFMGDSARGKLEDADDTTINAAMEAAESPDFAALAEALVNGRSATEE